MNKNFKKALNENKKPVFITVVAILISIFLIIITVENSYYWAFISFPLTILTVYLTHTIIIQISDGYKYLSSKEENMPDNIYNHYYPDSNQIKQTFTLKNGEREGASQIFNKSNILVLELEYSNGVIISSIEYYENGNKRMVYNDSKYIFYDENSILRIEINLQEFIIGVDQYKHLEKNIWAKWIWNYELRALYKPIGVWKEFNESGNLIFEFDFNNYDINKYKDFNVLKTCYDSEGNIESSNDVSPIQLNIERFGTKFYFERLVDKKARYKTIHLHRKGWQYKEFDIPVVNNIKDLLDFKNENKTVLDDVTENLEFEIKIDTSNLPESPIKSLDDLDPELRKKVEKQTVFLGEDGVLPNINKKDGEIKNDIFCPKCGSKQNENKFCTNCGNKLI